MEISFLLNELKSVSSLAWCDGMQRYGIENVNALGVSMPNIRSIAKSYNKNKSIVDRHKTALELWVSNIHEARILASIIDHPKLLTPQQMDKWTADFNSWDVCDQVCSNLFQKAPFFLEKAFEYSYSNDEFIKRTGFVLMVQYAVHHKKAPDEKCLEFLKRIEEEAWDDRNFIRKAVNWCLRSIGKRSQFLHPYAIACAEKLLLQENKSATWIAQDALKELNSEAVHKRININ